jgi:hypothetical protein
MTVKKWELDEGKLIDSVAEHISLSQTEGLVIFVTRQAFEVEIAKNRSISVVGRFMTLSTAYQCDVSQGPVRVQAARPP